MNSDSEDSFLAEDSFQESYPKPEKPGRARLTLLADLHEPNASNISSDVDSPVRNYLKNLQQERLHQEKENLHGNGNRREAVQCKAEQDWREQTRPSYEMDKKRAGLNPVSQNRDNNVKMTKGQRLVHRQKRREREESERPGIYLYKIKINLAEPAQSWSSLNLGDSYLRSSFESKSPFPHASHKACPDDRLFQNALHRHKQSRNH